MQEKYIDLLNEAPTEDPMIGDIKRFIESFEGDDSDELHILIMGIVGLLLRIEKLTIDADAYKNIEEAKNEVNKELEGLKMQFEMVNTEKPPETIVESQND